jgi:hypothetical protein
MEIGAYFMSYELTAQTAADKLDAYIGKVAEEIRSVCRNISTAAPDIQGAGRPFNPVTGAAFSGANMVRLLFASLRRGFKDNRWLTADQLKATAKANPDATMQLRDGEKGIELLHPKALSILVGDEKNAHSPAGDAVLFTPITVYNASQIDGFPPKAAVRSTPAESVAAVEEFIASTGLSVVHAIDEEKAYYSPSTATVVMPSPSAYDKPQDYTSAKLEQCVSAIESVSGKSSVEEYNTKTVFRCISPAVTDLPRWTPNVQYNSALLSTGEEKDIYRAAIDAGRIISVIDNCLNKHEVTNSPSWLPAYKTRHDLIADARKKLDGMSWFDRAGMPFREDGRVWYDKECEMRAKYYALAYMTAVKEREKTFERYSESGFFDAHMLKDIRRDIDNKPLEFSFRNGEELFFVKIDKDREMIDRFEQAVSENFASVQSDEAMKRLENADFKSLRAAEASISDLVAEREETRRPRSGPSLR